MASNRLTRIPVGTGDETKTLFNSDDIRRVKTQMAKSGNKRFANREQVMDFLRGTEIYPTQMVDAPKVQPSIT